MGRLISALLVVSAVVLAVVSCATVPAGNPATGYSIHGFVGKDAQSAAANTSVLLIDGGSGQALATHETDFFGKFVFSGLQPGHYQLKVGEIVQDVVLHDENVRRDINLSDPTGAMNYAEAGLKDLSGQVSSATSGKGAPAGPNDPSLAADIAGTWWGFTGSTETKIGLCPDGSYTDYSESGYSGTMTDAGGNQTGAWGSASQGGGQGTWSIQGTGESGTIRVQYNSGRSATIEYRQCGEKGCLFFDGRKLCRSSAQCQ